MPKHLLAAIAHEQLETADLPQALAAEQKRPGIMREAATEGPALQGRLLKELRAQLLLTKPSTEPVTESRQ